MPVRMLLFVLAYLFVTVTAAHAAPQDVGLAEAWTGGFAESFAGVSVTLVGDLDDDGVEDVAWGEPGPTMLALTPGRVVVRSGADGSTLAELLGADVGAAFGDRFGAALAGGGDFDGDGTPDIAVGSPRHGGVFRDGGRVTVFSGATFLPWMHFEATGPDQRLGSALDFVADLDGDGDDELLAGAPHADPSQAGSARLFAGGTGAPLATLTSGATEGDFMGRAVADVGDVDADGVHDVGVGAPGHQLNASRVLVYSGDALGQGLGAVVLLDIPGNGIFGSLSTFGYALDGAGDVDGDGHDDLVVGHPFKNGNRGQVTVQSGADGAQLLRRDGTFNSTLGRQVAGLGDLDGDGVPDFGGTGQGDGVLGAEGLARAWSGANGDLLLDVPPDAEDRVSFAALARAGDRDGDGRPEVFVGLLETDEGNENNPGRGKLLRVELGEPLVYRGRGLFGDLPGTQDDVGLPQLAAGGELTAGSPVALEVVGARPSATLFLVVGLSELLAPLEGGILVPAADLVLVLATDADGGLSVGGTWPAGVPGGTTVSFQAWQPYPIPSTQYLATNGVTSMTP